MKTKLNSLLFIALAASVLVASSCKKEENPFIEKPIVAVNGVFILNEGSSSQNNASFSFFDLKSKKMQNNVFGSANPTMTLGNGGNDIGVYGSKIYIAMNGSNKLEIANVVDGKSLKTIQITEPSYIAFHGKHAFVTSYTNNVFVIDTASMAIVKEIKVGKTPEQLVVSGDFVFVTNSGWKDGFSGAGFDNTVSVIDAKTLTKTHDIVVEDNINQIEADNNGFVYVLNAPIYAIWPIILTPARFHVINTKTLKVEKILDISASAMAIKGNTAYLINDTYGVGEISFVELNLTSFEVTKRNEVLSGIQDPYSLAVDPDSGDIWIGDAMGYGDNGKVVRFIKNVKDPESYSVGVSPRKIVFKR